MKLRGILIFTAMLLFAVTSDAQTPSSTPSAANSPEQAHVISTVDSFLRNLFSWGPAYQLKVGPLKEATIPGFYEVAIEVKFQEQTQGGVVYASKDGNFIIRGELYKASDDPFAAARALLTSEGSPSKGLANAKVTLVEFSDFECPHCRELHESLKSIETKYPQVRIVFKNLPIEHIHPWAMTAALAGRCAFQSSPDAFWKIEAQIFDQQDLISPENAYDKMAEFAASAGIPSDGFRTCLADPAAKAAVDADIVLAQKLNISSTPTVFINGREAVGGEPTALEQLIDYELRPKP